MVTYIVINRHIINKNKGLPPELRKPPIRVTLGRYGKPKYFFEFEPFGDCKIVYDPEHPMPCGATLWMEIRH
jgi:hypothetical protein